MFLSTTLLSISMWPSSRKQTKTLPVRERVSDRRAKLDLLADELEVGAQPGLELFDRRDRTTFVGGTATHACSIR